VAGGAWLDSLTRSKHNRAMAMSSPAEPMLECRGLCKRFGEREAVRGVSFQIAEGETYGSLGPNGAGKTTTISIVCGLLEADAGDVIVAGEPLTTRSVRAKAAIGYVPQELAIYPDLSARENLRFFARLYGLTSAEANERIEEVLRVIGLAERAWEQAKNYSGGMQRRLNIGIGLLHRPRLLVLGCGRSYNQWTRPQADRRRGSMRSRKSRLRERPILSRVGLGSSST
jgi:ABC-2 type transport system ATP-binding protein